MNQLTNEIFKPAFKNFERRSVVVPSNDLIWGADLIDVSEIKGKIKFLLNVIDIHSRYAWSIPLTSKSKDTVLNAFKEIVNETKTTPSKIWADEGGEFYNSVFKKYCTDNNIILYSTHSGLKSVFAERFNRTMKEAFYKYLSNNKKATYTAFLPIFMNEYNNTIRRATHETPNNIYYGDAVSKEIKKVNTKHPAPKFQVGDFVRLSKLKRTFEKGYTSRYTHEPFKISSIDTTDFPYMYQLEDLMGEKIEGKAYEKELIITLIPKFKVIEKVVKRKTENGKKFVMVSYIGHDSKFDEWMPESEYKKKVR
jgi:hypothetical protein